MSKKNYSGNLFKHNTMQYILTCPNGKKIDMSEYILMQLSGKITRDEVQTRIDYYKSTNQN